MLPSSTTTPKPLEINGLGQKSNKNSNKKSRVKAFDTMDKKNLRLFTSHDNIDKDWFIEYYEYKGSVKIRKQFKGGINRGKTVNVLCAQIEHLKDYPLSHFIFGKNGEPGAKALGYNAFYNRHKAILDKLGMYTKGKNQYSYKHYGAVSMARNKVPLMELKKQGRWHSLDQMLDYLEDFGVNDLNTIESIELM